MRARVVGWVREQDSARTLGQCQMQWRERLREVAMYLSFRTLATVWWVCGGGRAGR